MLNDCPYQPYSVLSKHDPGSWLYRLLLCTLLFLFGYVDVYGQNQRVQQAWVVSGGLFSEPDGWVRLGAYEPEAGTYTFLDSVRGNYTNDAVVYGDYLYFNAVDTLYQLDLLSGQRIGQLYCPGIRRMEVAGDRLVLARWFPANDSLVWIVDAQSLEIQTIMDEEFPHGSTQDVVLHGNRAYVAHNQKGTIPQPPFDLLADTLGFIEVIDLRTGEHLETVELDTAGAGVNDLVTDGQRLYALCSANSAIIEINPADLDTTIYFTGAPATRQAAGIRGNRIYLSLSSAGVGIFNLNTGRIEDTVRYAGSFVRTAIDTTSETDNPRLYATISDYATFGQLRVYDTSGTVMDSSSVGISPEALVLRYTPVVDRETSRSPDGIECWSVSPNPVSNDLYIKGSPQFWSTGYESVSDREIELVLYAPDGRVVIQSPHNIEAGLKPEIRIPMRDLPTGVYTLQINQGNVHQVRKILKVN